MKKKKMTLVWMLIAALFISGIPINGLMAVASNPSGWQLTIMDEENNPVPDANVEYHIKVNNTEKAAGNVSSNSSGVAEIDDVATFNTEISNADDEVTIHYTVAKTGYKTIVKEEDITNSIQDVNIVLEKLAEITVKETVGGSVFVNGGIVDAEAPIYIEKPTTAAIQIKAEEGYQIKAVTIGAVGRDVASHENYPREYTEDVAISGDLEIEAAYIAESKVTVYYSGESGVISVNDEEITQEGEVTYTYVEGNTVKIKAVANDTYRIARVLKNGVEQEIAKNQEEYEDTIVIENTSSNYDYEIVFSLKVFDVIKNEPEHGEITIGNTENIVNYGGSLVFQLEPDKGYVTDIIKVNGFEVEESCVARIRDDVLEVALESVATDSSIEVLFKKETEVDAFAEGYLTVTETVRKDERLFVYGKDSNVDFKTDREGIRINGNDENRRSEQIFRIEGPTDETVSEIELFYQAEGEKRADWHKVILPDEGLRIIFDEIAPSVTLTPQAIQYEYYNSDVDIAIGAVETEEEYSGISSVLYEITGYEGEEVKAVTNGALEVSLAQEKEFQGVITVDAEEFNYEKVEVKATVSDAAGNEKTESVTLKINSTNPRIDIQMDGTESEAGGYYQSGRTATVTVMDRKDTFDLEKVQIKITTEKADETEKYVISEWATDSGDTSKHRATITFAADAKYKWSMEYTNKANMSVYAGADKADENVTASGGNVYAFTADGTMPLGTVQIGNHNWNNILVNPIAFSLWKKQPVSVSISASDATAGMKSVYYYRTSSAIAGDAEAVGRQLENLYSSGRMGEFSTFQVPGDEQFVIYARLEDRAGNVNYISSNGLVVDRSKPRIEIKPQGTPANGIYNGNVKADIRVYDPRMGNTYSGLNTITYAVRNMGVTTHTETLYNSQNQNQRQDWAGSINVDSIANNSNDVVIEVTATDNAGNVYTAATSIKIDTTAPTIAVTYDNNSPDSEKYYKETRTATITVTERNFDAKDMKPVIKVVRNDGTEITKDGTEIAELVGFSGWVKQSEGSGNGDDITHQATIAYEADGDYAFDISFKDLAENNSMITYPEVNPKEFTIDKTVPELSVRYDNNDAANEKYFMEARTATITVTEHNFDAERMDFEGITAKLNDANITLPEVSWKHDGDTHTAAIQFNKDGDYTFDVSMRDMAGNELKAEDVVYERGTQAANDFTVDLTLPKIDGCNLSSGTAYGYDDELIPEISFSDINFASYKGELKRTHVYFKDGGIVSEKDEDVTETFMPKLKEGTAESENLEFKFESFDKIPENDGIYTLTINLEDKAGNQSEPFSVTFTVNRFGSVYNYDENLAMLIKDGGAYVQAVENDIVITEYNADRLKEDSLNIEITRNGYPLEEVKYNVDPEINEDVSARDNSWYQYTYTISKENFGIYKDDKLQQALDGTYKIVISSKDDAGNTSVNSSTDNKAEKFQKTNYPEESEIDFWVDSSAPDIEIIRGLEEEIINATKTDISYKVFDAVGLQSVEVYVDEKMIGDRPITDFGEDDCNYEGSFTLTESSEKQHIQIIATDKAGNKIDTADRFEPAFDFHDSITVSTNFFVRWWANQPLFWGSIGGGTVIVAAGIWLSWFLRRKKTVKGKAEE